MLNTLVISLQMLQIQDVCEKVKGPFHEQKERGGGSDLMLLSRKLTLACVRMRVCCYQSEWNRLQFLSS